MIAIAKWHFTSLLWPGNNYHFFQSIAQTQKSYPGKGSLREFLRACRYTNRKNSDGATTARRSQPQKQRLVAEWDTREQSQSLRFNVNLPPPQIYFLQIFQIRTLLYGDRASSSPLALIDFVMIFFFFALFVATPVKKFFFSSHSTKS